MLDKFVFLGLLFIGLISWFLFMKQNVCMPMHIGHFLWGELKFRNQSFACKHMHAHLFLNTDFQYCLNIADHDLVAIMRRAYLYEPTKLNAVPYQLCEGFAHTTHLKCCRSKKIDDVASESLLIPGGCQSGAPHKPKYHWKALAAVKMSGQHLQVKDMMAHRSKPQKQIPHF